MSTWKFVTGWLFAPGPGITGVTTMFSFVLLAAILEIRPLSIHGGSGGNRSETSLYRSGAVMPKNIVVFSDGTGQEGGKTPNSNVYKLFNMLENRTDRQVTFYDRGLGTGWRKLGGNLFGAGISHNIKECYRFIFDNYQAGDRIFLFGFSRGATTVRSLSAFIHLFGILPKSRPELIDEAWSIYKTGRLMEGRRDRRKEKADAFIRRHNTMWTRICFLGVWDTVAALGIPSQWWSAVLDKIPFCRHRFHDLRLSPSVETAVHALALDDERKTFHPTLWDPEIESYQRMKQVWFCGAHTDVGGGYAEQSLSDIPLAWMVQQAAPCGLHIYPQHQVQIAPDIEGILHDSREGIPGRYFRREVRTWPVSTHGRPVIHASVRERRANSANTVEPPYSSWIFDLDPQEEPWVPEVPDGRTAGTT